VTIDAVIGALAADMLPYLSATPSRCQRPHGPHQRRFFPSLFC